MSWFVLLPQHAPRHQSFPSVLKETNTALSLWPRKQGILVFHSAEPSKGIKATCSQTLDFPLAEACSTELGFTTRLHKGSSPGREPVEAGEVEIPAEGGHRGCAVPGHTDPLLLLAALLPPSLQLPQQPSPSSHCHCLSPRSLHKLHKPSYQTYQTAFYCLRLPK